MKRRLFNRWAGSLGLAMLAGSALPLALAGSAAAAADDIPTMTVKIYNNTGGLNIYPVLSTGTATEGKWLQAIFKVPQSELKENPYPKLNQFRIYINPAKDGIPPGGSVTLTLPFYTQLVPTNRVDPKKTDQYIDWWGGGRIEIFDAPVGRHAPPAALLQNLRNRPDQTRVNPIAGAALPTCVGCDPIRIFKDPAGLKHNEPSQLTEYTLGSLKLNKDPIGLDLHNVDFDVSYVDNAYLPVAMEPVNNVQVGYIGMITPVGAFRNALKDFLDPKSPYAGWPVYVDNQKREILKVPSTLHILGAEGVDLTKGPWPPLTEMRDDWDKCVKDGPSTQFCNKINEVRDLFIANYKRYKDKYLEIGCDPKKEPVPRTETLIYTHVQGWTPFNINCPNPKANLLEKTPGYEDNNYKEYLRVKELFDELEYWKDGKFNPYVQLIHSEKYIGAENVYAYSVDDAVGNMQAYGDGIIIAVGGKRGLPNPDKATPPININFGYGAKDKVKYVKYGICNETPRREVDPDFTSFTISATSIGKCPLTFLDNNGLLYRFELKSQPPYAETPRLAPETHAPIDCRGIEDPKLKTWCAQIFAYDVPDIKKPKSTVVVPAPDQSVSVQRVSKAPN